VAESYLGRASPEVVQQALADLVERLGVAVDDVQVRRAVAVTWRDGSIGCPQPGMAYTQAIVPGHLVELEVGGTVYRYHQGGARPPFLCERPDEPYEIEGSRVTG
jgi:hypothetical protein